MPFTVQQAVARLYRSGLTLSEALEMEDRVLLCYRYVGRKTLRVVRSIVPVQT